MRHVRALAGLFLVALALAGCSLVPTSKTPQLIAPKQVGLSILGKTIPGTNNGRVRFISRARLYRRRHRSPLRLESNRAVTARTRVGARQLIIGPTAIEAQAGYTSALPKNLIILSASFRGGIGYIDLGSSLAKLPRGQEVLAVGQMVLTSHVVGLTLGIADRGIEITVAGVAQDCTDPGRPRSEPRDEPRTSRTS